MSDVLPDHITSFYSTENQEKPIYQLLRQYYGNGGHNN